MRDVVAWACVVIFALSGCASGSEKGGRTATEEQTTSEASKPALSLEFPSYSIRSRDCGAWREDENILYEVMTLRLTNHQSSILRKSAVSFVGETPHGVAVAACETDLEDVAIGGTQEFQAVFKITDHGDGKNSYISYLSVYEGSSQTGDLLLRKPIHYATPTPPPPPPPPQIGFAQDQAAGTLTVTSLSEPANWKDIMFYWIYSEDDPPQCHGFDPSGSPLPGFGRNGPVQSIAVGDFYIIKGYSSTRCDIKLGFVDWDSPSTEFAAPIGQWSFQVNRQGPHLRFQQNYTTSSIEVRSAAEADWSDIRVEVRPGNSSKCNGIGPSGEPFDGADQQFYPEPKPVLAGDRLQFTWDGVEEGVSNYCDIVLQYGPTSEQIGTWQFSAL